MNAVDSELAERICQELIEKKLITEKEAKQLTGKLATGAISATQWTTTVRAMIATEESGNGGTKA